MCSLLLRWVAGCAQLFLTVHLHRLCLVVHCSFQCLLIRCCPLPESFRSPDIFWRRDVCHSQLHQCSAFVWAGASSPARRVEHATLRAATFGQERPNFCPQASKVPRRPLRDHTQAFSLIGAVEDCCLHAGWGPLYRVVFHISCNNYSDYV